MKRKYGWRHSLPDPRDHRKEHARCFLASQPRKLDRLTLNIRSFDQANHGSCTGHGGKRLVENCVYDAIPKYFSDLWVLEKTKVA